VHEPAAGGVSLEHRGGDGAGGAGGDGGAGDHFAESTEAGGEEPEEALSAGAQIVLVHVISADESQLGHQLDTARVTDCAVTSERKM